MPKDFEACVNAKDSVIRTLTFKNRGKYLHICKRQNSSRWTRGEVHNYKSTKSKKSKSRRSKPRSKSQRRKKSSVYEVEVHFESVRKYLHEHPKKQLVDTFQPAFPRAKLRTKTKSQVIDTILAKMRRQQKRFV